MAALERGDSLGGRSWTQNLPTWSIWRYRIYENAPSETPHREWFLRFCLLDNAQIDAVTRGTRQLSPRQQRKTEEGSYAVRVNETLGGPRRTDMMRSGPNRKRQTVLCSMVGEGWLPAILPLNIGKDVHVSFHANAPGRTSVDRLSMPRIPRLAQANLSNRSCLR